MITIDLTKPIVCERDIIKHDAYCIECFCPPSSTSLYFYNGYGPLCSKQCFSDYVGIPYEKLPNIDMRGIIR